MSNIFNSLKPSLTWSHPQLFDVKDETELTSVEELVSSGKVTRFFDSMQFAVDELYDIKYPHEKDIPNNQKSAYKDFALEYEWPRGTFAYFSWDNTLMRIPVKEEFRALRTSRNRNLVNADEQRELYGATIFVAGLSVGSNIVEALVSMGIGGKFILADMDVIEPSNLNRIRSPYQDVGAHKADALSMRMSQIDPYLDFELYRDGVNEQSLQEILDKYKPTIIVDEMDQVQMKILMRQEAKKRGIAVVSAADNGDSALVDIERYDTDPDYKPYHGLIPDQVLKYLETTNDIPRQNLGLLIGKYFVGPKHIPLRMFQSLTEVGRTLPSWPQLGGAAAQSGIAIAYTCRRIILEQPLRAGRFVVGPDQVLNPEIEDEQHQAELASFQKQLEDFSLGIE